MPQSEVTGLFPIPFMRIKGLLSRPLVEALVEELRCADTETNAKSELLSHTAVVTPETSPRYREASEAILPFLGEFGVLLFGEALPWRIKEMWMNVLEHGGQQALHAHANSFISGVVYLTESHPSARTVLYRGLGGRDFTFSNEHSDVQHGPFNSPKWAVPQMSPGDMALFPSYVLHEVPKNLGKQRITLALNAVPERLRSWGYEIRFGCGRV